jgi:hypothetical protein
VQLSNERQRHGTLFDDSPAVGLTAAAADTMTSLVGSSALEPESPMAGQKSDRRKFGPPLPPQPEKPVDLPEPPAGDAAAISVRQLLTYLCQGQKLEEGLERALMVLSPAGHSGGSVSAEDFHAALFQLGVRPTPSSYEADGQPAHPSVVQLYEKLGLYNAQEMSNLGLPRRSVVKDLAEMSVSSFFQINDAKTLMDRFGIGQRHCIQPVDKIFPA